MSAVDSNLSATAGQQYHVLRSPLWATIDEEIDLPQCDIYRYLLLYKNTFLPHPILIF